MADPNDYDWEDKRSKEIKETKKKIRQVEDQVVCASPHRNRRDDKLSRSMSHLRVTLIPPSEAKGMNTDGTIDENGTDDDDPSYTNEMRGTITLPSIDLQEHFEPPVYPKTPWKEEFLKHVLQDNFLFSDLTDAELQKLVNAMQSETVIRKEQEVIIQQGDVGDFFYVVESGEVDFILDGDKNVGSCGPGGCFGELALLYNSPRAVSCVAASDTVELFKVEQRTFRYLLAHHAAEHDSSIKELLKKVSIFKDLSDDDFSRFTTSLTPVHWKEGARIVQKGEEGKVFYILQEGSAKIHDIGLGDSQFEDQILQPGDWFGERALLTGEPRAANVTALTAVTTMAMDRDTFESIIGPLQHLMEREMRCQFLKGLPIFARGKVTDQEFSQLVDSMKEVCYRKGDKLAEAGKPYEMNLWIIRHGRLLVTSSKPEKSDVIYDLQSGDYFGDKSIGGDPKHISAHTAICEENLTTWVVTRKDIETVLGDLGRLGESPKFVKHIPDKPVLLSELTRHRVLGQGAFGRVFLVSHKTDEPGKKKTTAYALKAISKHQLLRSKQVDSVLREKEMLALLNHPFILRLISTFQDEDHVYLLLPIIPGGELFRVLHSQKTRGAGLPNFSVAFYSACVIEALSHFHQRNIAYRDLKLENVLMDAKGYCTIVDLGFAKVVPEKTYTLVGTPEYLAPEIIMSKGHNKASDYWAFGVLVYELFVGTSPFYDRNSSQLDMFKRAVMMKYKIPSFVNDLAQDLITRLLIRRPSKRLGNLANGYLDIKRHEWFEISGINFGSILRKEVEAPWVPEVKDELDASNFDRYDEEEDDTSGGRLTKDEQDLFKGF